MLKLLQFITLKLTQKYLQKVFHRFLPCVFPFKAKLEVSKPWRFDCWLLMLYGKLFECTIFSTAGCGHLKEWMYTGSVWRLWPPKLDTTALPAPLTHRTWGNTLNVSHWTLHNKIWILNIFSLLRENIPSISTNSCCRG